METPLTFRNDAAFAARLAILAVALLLAACRGGGGSGGADGAAASHTLGGTLTGLTAVQSVVLKNNGGDPLTRSANGSFTFPTPLANGARYEVSVFTPVEGQTCRVTNGTGVVAATNVSNVTVACAIAANAGTWSSASRISDARSSLEYELYAGDVDVNEDGVAMALWVEESKSSGVERLWGTAYRGGGWGVPAAIAETGSKDGVVAVLPDGDAIVVYAQQAYEAFNLAMSQRLYARRFDSSKGRWSAPTQISVDFPNDSWPLTPNLAASANGDALAVWTHDGQVWARRYTQAWGWSTAASQLSESPRSVGSPKVVADANGIFTAVWIEDSDAYDPALPDGGPNRASVFARRFDGEWGVRQRIGWSADRLAGSFDSASRLSLDANAEGAVIVVWEQSRTLDDGRNQKSIDAARFEHRLGRWSAPQTIATHAANLSWPRVALSASGRALAIWTRSETHGDGVTTLRGAWFSPQSGTWDRPQLFDQTGTGSVSHAVLTMDAAGNAELAWNEVGKGLVERRFDARSGQWGGWTTRPPSGSDLQLAMSDSGHVVLICDYLNLNPLPWTREISAWAYAP